MARPSIPAVDRRTRKITISCTKKEYLQIERCAGALPVGTWLRITVLALLDKQGSR